MSQQPSSATARRIQEELLEMRFEPPPGCTAVPRGAGQNLFQWTGTINGPDNTPYFGGLFLLDIDFSADYPAKPPKIVFKTRTYHCNIDPDNGAVCLSILNEKNWQPQMRVSNILLTIQCLLADPNPDDPVDPKIAKQYNRNKQSYFQKAKDWTDKFAKP